MRAVMPHAIREFVARGWPAVRDRQDAYWAARIAHLGPLEALQVGDALRQQARQLVRLRCPSPPGLTSPRCWRAVQRTSTTPAPCGKPTAVRSTPSGSGMSWPSSGKRCPGATFARHSSVSAGPAEQNQIDSTTPHHSS